MGPRQDAGEDTFPDFSMSTRCLASMGPRQDAGEDIGGSITGSASRQCFNGAPAGCRGRLSFCISGVHSRSRLQWGPGRMPGKTNYRLTPDFSAIPASMGPRQDAGEDGTYVRKYAAKLSRFNGAPAGCRGRHGAYSQCTAGWRGLQWGPGRMPGKTWGLKKIGSTEISFNGAPAGCRGRQDIAVLARDWGPELQWGPGRMPGKTELWQRCQIHLE